MAIYTTFFLCEPHELLSAFPGWKPPLPHSVSRIWANPFTGAETTIKTREPEWDDVDPNEVQLPERRAVATKGDHETYLESRIPQFIQSKPHWCAKNLTSIELGPLISVATGGLEQTLETALYAHPSLNAGIQRFPHEFIARLKSADEATQNTIAQQWATKMSTPDFTLSVSGERIRDDMPIDGALDIVRTIAELAKKQDDDQSMYLLIEAL